MDQVVMTENQQRMDQLIKSFIKSCCLMENQHEGLTTFVYTKDVKKIEAKMDQMYKESNLTGFVLALNSMRNAWMTGLTNFTQLKMLSD